MKKLADLSPHARSQIRTARCIARRYELAGDQEHARDWRMITTCFLLAAHQLRRETGIWIGENHAKG